MMLAPDYTPKPPTDTLKPAHASRTVLTTVLVPLAGLLAFKLGVPADYVLPALTAIATPLVAWFRSEDRARQAVCAERRHLAAEDLAALADKIALTPEPRKVDIDAWAARCRIAAEDVRR